MKKSILLLLFFSIYLNNSTAQINLGAGANYISNGSLIGIGGKALYMYNDNFGGQLAIHYILSDGADFIVDLDIHYDGLKWGSDKLRMTPFIGLSQNGGVTVRSMGSTVAGGSTRSTSFNLGINGRIPLNDKMKLYIQPKLVLGKNSAIALGSGVYF